MKNKYEIENKARLLWGKDLWVKNPRRKKIVPAHCYQLENIFKKKWTKSLHGKLLEIGCGSGSDLEVFSKIKKIKNITAIDLGEHVEKLSKKYRKNKNIFLERGNALSLKFKNNEFDIIYSFGVFHHSVNPKKCISEANRVLKKNGKLFLYLYGSHEDLIVKRIGILFEKLIMKLFHWIPYSFQNIICNTLSPICWFIFSIPSFILKFLGFNGLSKKFPFYFATHPFSLIDDLKDRLMSPINHRYSKDEIQRILKSFNFSLIEVVKKSSGLYIYAVK